MLKIVMRTCLMACLLMASAVRADDGAQTALKHFVDGVHTLQADFTQVQTDDKGRMVKAQSGQMWLSRPGKFRWSYDKPYKQLIVCDGNKIWVYDPDLQQVTVRSAEQTLTGSPAALLSQRAALSDAFTLQNGGSDQGLQLVRLIPKSKDSDYKSIALLLRGGVPMRMIFHDQLGDTIDVSFSNVKTNAPIAASVFQFKPPAGVTVVGGTAPGPD